MTDFVDYFGLGIDRYPELSLGSHRFGLDYAASDCIKISNTLSAIGIQAHAWMATDTTSAVRPIRNHIYRGVRSFLSQAGNDKPKIFYFAGHGISIGGGLHICSSDFDDDIAEKCAIDVSEIVLDFCRASPWSVFILDCCRAPLQMKQKGRFPVAHGGSGIRILDNSIIISSCSQGEFSYEAASIDGRVSGGIFTHFLCQSLRSLFRKRGSIRVSVADIFNMARDGTIEFVLDEARKSQTPRMIGAQATDYFLLRH